MRTSLLLMALSVVTGGPAEAQQSQAPKPLVLSARNMMAGDSVHLALAAAGRDPSVLLPGDVVGYQLRFSNLLRDSVRAVVFDNPVPGGMHYVDQTATADRSDVVVEFSADGGKSFSATPMIERMENGRRVSVPAPAESYTHVRWRVTGWVAPGAQVTAQFRARLAPAQ
jgi:uncharacterized repeat protein (TIGR01451 family)